MEGCCTASITAFERKAKSQMDHMASCITNQKQYKNLDHLWLVEWCGTKLKTMILLSGRVSGTSAINIPLGVFWLILSVTAHHNC